MGDETADKADETAEASGSDLVDNDSSIMMEPTCR